MGKAYGEQFRAQIHEFARWRMWRLQTCCKDQGGYRLSKKEILQLIAPAIQWHRHYRQDIWEEFCGIVSGADITPEMLLIATGLTDLMDFLLREIKQITRPIDTSGGCSAFIIPGHLTGNGVICAQTWDMSLEAINYLLLVHRKPAHLPETLYLTTVGGFALMGINSDGIAVGNTNLMTADHAPGVNYLFTISAALTAPSIDAAVGGIINTPRLSGHNFYVADGKSAVNIEASAVKAFCTSIRETVFMHTNHCLNPSLQELELPKTAALKHSSLYRLQRLEEHFKQDRLSWDPETCWKLLGDNTRSSYGAAICNDNYTSGEVLLPTVASCILFPQEKKMWVCAGGTQYGSRQELSL